MAIQQVLVLGAQGRIGTILRRCWSGGPVLWQSRAERAEPGWLAGDPLGGGAALAAAAARAGGCATVLCLAGVVPGRGSLETNAPLAEAAVRLGAALGARVLLASSAAVYGPAERPAGEGRALAPVTDYGRAKAAAEARAAALAAELGVAATALRIGNIAGLDAILGGWRPGFELDTFAGGRTPRRSYIGPASLARVLEGLCRAGPLPGALNIAAPGVLEMGALLDAAGLDWAPRPAPPGALPEVALDVAAMMRFCPLPPEASLAAAMVAEWRQTGGGADAGL